MDADMSTVSALQPLASRYFDALETRLPEQREAELFARLPTLVARAMARAPGWARHLAGVDPHALTDRAALAALPVLRKRDLKTLQAAEPPFGGLTTVPRGRLARIYMSPGPTFDPEGDEPDPWRVARALWAAGIRPGHLLQNCFGYHMTPTAWMIDQAARRIGCAVIPAGPGQIEQQLELIAELRPEAYVGTPSFLRTLLEKAAQRPAGGPGFERALLAAEALPASLRAWFAERGVGTVLQWFGTADLGCVAYESSPDSGLIVEEDSWVEIVRPGTGDPVPDGEIGEIVVTRFSDSYPMIRFATGDLSAMLPGCSACGRSNRRIRGWLGRADQAAKVRGLFVYPEHVAMIVAGLPEVLRARLVISGEMANDQMELRCEMAVLPDNAQTRQALASRIVERVRDNTRLRADVRLLAAGSLPNDGKVIEDLRRSDVCGVDRR